MVNPNWKVRIDLVDFTELPPIATDLDHSVTCYSDYRLNFTSHTCKGNPHMDCGPHTELAEGKLKVRQLPREIQ